ncbi:hypothetical protein IW262DRAFT_1302040 [Armillaria fumosa]|nr:hypothetical protein IW262DRAFT_1302040 [Armillaria fumosa]
MGQDARSRVRQPETLRHHVWNNLLADMETWSAPTGESSNAILDDVPKGPVLNVADLNRSTSLYADIAVAITCSSEICVHGLGSIVFVLDGVARYSDLKFLDVEVRILLVEGNARWSDLLTDV